MAEDFADDEPLEATDDLWLALPFGDPAPGVVDGELVGAHAHDHHAIERGVGLAMAASVEPVPAGPGRGRRRGEGPGRKAARCRSRAILPESASSCSRKATGTLTMVAVSVSMARVRLLTAVSRATLRWRITSTVLVPDYEVGRLAAQHGTGGAPGVEVIGLARCPA